MTGPAAVVGRVGFVLLVLAMTSAPGQAARALTFHDLQEPAIINLVGFDLARAEIEALLKGADLREALWARGPSGEGGVSDEEVLWFGVRLKNLTDQTAWALVLRHAFVARLDLWTMSGDGAPYHHAAGMGYPDRIMQPRLALGYEAPVHLPRGAETTIVVRIEPILYLGADPLLMPAALARSGASWRSLIFPLLLGTYLGIAALHLILFFRFGGVANLWFTATVVSIFLDWFVWLGGLHDLGVIPTVENTLILSSITWTMATFFIWSFCINFFAGGENALRYNGAMLLLFVGLATLPAWMSVYEPAMSMMISLFLIASACVIGFAAVQAIRRGLPGSRLALIAYGIGLSSELSVYLGVGVPGLEEWADTMRGSVGLFDMATLLSQIGVNGLFSLALWERLRAHIRDREAAAQLERMRAVEIAQLCHDIRSPLHAIQSVIGAIGGRRSSGLSTPKDMETVQSSVRTMVGVLESIVELTMRGPSSGRTSRPDRGPTELREVVADAVAVTRAQLGSRPVVVEAAIDPALPPYVDCDAIALRRILGNLLSNAVKVTSTGSIGIEVALRPGPPASMWFKVEDTGHGIELERIVGLFGPEPRYAGFGLTVVHRLVAAAGGTLGASSRLGRGTAVWFMLPAAAVPPTAVQRPRPDVARFGRALRLMVVEDDDLTAEAVSAFLESDGHRVTRVANAGNAVAAAQTPFDLVLMDLGIDDGSGLGAIRDIRGLKDPVRAAVPIIVTTGDRLAEERLQRGTRLGVRAILIKPFDFVELREAIGSIFDPIGAPRQGSDKSQPRFLNDLAETLPPNSFVSLLSTARQQIESNHQALERAMTQMCWPEIAKQAHRLASAAGIVGFLYLSRVARETEAAAKERDAQRIGRSIGLIREAVEQAIHAIEARLGAVARSNDGPS